MLWLLLGEGRFYSGASGDEVLYNFPVQSWGLQVKDILGAIVATGRGSTNAKVRLRFDDGATDDLNSLLTANTNNVIHSGGSPIALPTTLPGTLKGSASGTFLPYLRFQLGVSGLATGEWVEVKTYVGGRPF